MITRNSIQGKYPIKTLSEVAEFLDNLRRPITTSNREAGPYPYYGANGQQDSVADYIFDEPLILIAEDGGLFDQPDRGIAYVIEGKTWVNNHAHVLRPKKCIDLRFLLRVLENYDVTPWITGSTRAKLTKGAASNIEIPLPPLTEQKRIAAILDKSDSIRRNLQESLRLSDGFLRSVFLDMFGDPVTNPKGWNEVPFGELVESTKLGMVRSSTEFGWDMPVPYVRMDALNNDGGFLPEKVQGTQATKKDIAAYGLERGDFLFNTRNSKELVGKVAVYPGPSGATFNNNLMRIRFKKADPYFICHQFRFPRVKRELEARKQGTTSVFAVYWKNLATLPVLSPPESKQKEFRKSSDKIERSRSTLSQQLSEANHLFSALQQRAFRGEL
jgi:type I restriction enzyme, S subunit